MAYIKQTSCKHCGLSFIELTTNQRMNHSRWCSANPKRTEYVGTIKTATANIERLNQFSKAKKDGTAIPKSGNFGKPSTFKGKQHTDASKELIREKALASDHRRLRRKMIKYQCIDGTYVMLDSSWEEALATRLDELNVEWTRPAPIKYIGKDGKAHNYFPDFYLPKYDILLDPKNNAAYNVQIEKIEILVKLLPNLVILHSLAECKEYLPVV